MKFDKQVIDYKMDLGTWHKPDCDEEEVFIDDDLIEAYEWYDNWKKENFNNEKK